MSSKTLLAIKYDSSKHTLDILDQLKLPHQTIYTPIKSVDDAYTAIKTMVVRGAPAIAIVGALSLAVELNHKQGEFQSSKAVHDFVYERLDYLVTSRPTAVNLSQAIRELKKLTQEHVDRLSADDLISTISSYAYRMLENDIQDNKNIGKNGVEYITKELGLPTDGSQKISVLTICNTGSLATAGYGTALGIIRALHERGLLKHAYCLETRPYNQGSRLTAYELVVEGIPATLVTDSMASALLRANPDIQLVVAGADRVVKNGDTANKIGTYQLAITTHYHGRKFVIAAPTTSVDLNTSSGKDITIEQRPKHEVTQIRGPIVSNDKQQTVLADQLQTISTAAPSIDVWNPSFDVTPAELIDAIVTEKQAVVKHNGVFNL